MYYQNYEDYMRSVLGYPTNNSYTYDNYIVNDNRNYSNYENMEEFYPEIYKKINPLVCKECDDYSGPITKEVIDSMVDRIYSNIEMNNDIVVNLNVDNRNNKEKVITATNSRVINTDSQRTKENTRIADSENRQIRQNNPFLRDIIRILILERLFGGGRFPGRPPRPPFPGPGRPPVRPPYPGPIQPRQESYDNYLKF